MEKEKEAFQRRLSEVLKQYKQTWWAEKTNKGQSSVARWINGHLPGSGSLLKILMIGDISANWMLFGKGPKRLSDLNENAMRRRQDQGRDVQNQLLEMALENSKLRKKIEELERENSQKTIDWLFKRVDKKDEKDNEKEKVFKYNILPVLALMRQISEISYKVLEKYSKENIDDKKYREITQYIKGNNQKSGVDLKRISVELEHII